MGTATCTAPYATCASQRAARGKPAHRTRLAKVAIALAVIYVVFIGERWVLEHSPPAANELIVATCVVDVVFGDAIPANVCTKVGASDDK